MKTIRTFSQRFAKAIIPMLTMVLLFSGSRRAWAGEPQPGKTPGKDQTIMLALLLDTSNSMDGLIDQAKSQLWKIVNELAAAKCSDGARPGIRIALYEYGNDGLPSSEGYVRLVSPLTSDLDVISEKLFSLTTNGGNEYCGYVINKSLKQLEWSASNADLKMIFIAGNEPFTQGPIPYHMACNLAKEKDVVVNSIFCGPFSEGVETSWKRGAELTGGTYMSIEQDRKTVYIPSPYDEKIDALNDRLNDTYIYYGQSGAYKKEQQKVQDSNAESYGQANKVERAISKSSHAYKNSTWDLVDAAKDDEKVIAETKEEQLPKEMKGMSTEQRKAYVNKKSAERAQIQKEIQQLNEKRRVYIAQQSAGNAAAATLDASMLTAVRAKAKTKDLRWEK
ncbi:VWA domain-containing protein [Fulvivirgaceae bacterium PWU4]|uniref:VWA domain-containing protein n=1 Tax=Chryseosolibacter histidini TaxID=2782349 RepID=A0AAP2DS32_9BACT|nr:vWA domain-containing protein [Chryseosolibacter histidini]MBT1701448.1 VWA domain-containing protein [Chryseosolibacter histidini]